MEKTVAIITLCLAFGSYAFGYFVHWATSRVEVRISEHGIEITPKSVRVKTVRVKR